MEIDRLRVNDSDEWLAILGQSFQHDWFHLPCLHLMAEREGEGTAHLFVYREGQYLIALPLLLRPLEAIAGMEKTSNGWMDATSVDGYAGPVASHVEIPEQVLRNFGIGLRNALREMRVVALFSKLNPLIPQPAWLSGLGECVFAQQTISIDLRLPGAAQWAQFREAHKRGIRKLRDRGAVCGEDKEKACLGEFARLYAETMRRVNATRRFLFPPAYFEDLASRLGPHFHLFTVQLDGELASAGVFIDCNGIVEYQFGGTANKFVKVAPAKLVMDTVRLWATEAGHKTLHLGGGTSPKPDNSLFYFKQGFSDRVHPFLTWRWVLDPGAYEALCAEGARWRERNGLHAASPGFFPEYRTPVISKRSNHASIVDLVE